METQEPTVQKKSVMPYVIGVVLIVALAAAAFVAVRYFRQSAQDSGPSFMRGGAPEIVLAGPDGAEQSFKLDIVPAEELPKTQPEEMGIFVERKDNSLFIGTGDVTVMVEAKGSQDEPSVDTDYSGAKVEVVISNDTKIYKETTQLDRENPGAQVQQTVELGTIDDIAPNSSITVWGRKAGDRIIADIILFSQPMMFITNNAP